MLIYFAGFIADQPIAKIQSDIDFGLLVAYPETSYAGHQKLLNKANGRKVFLDSGAFSVFTNKHKIDIAEYTSFCKSNLGRFHMIANLDIIGNHMKTAQNQIFMEAHGVPAMPTFHYGTPYDILNTMASQYEYIGLGGLVPLASRKNILIDHLSKCFSIIGTKIKTHGWGMTSPFILSRFPFFSVDSTSWLHGMKSNRVVRYNRKLLKLESFIPEFWTSQHYRSRDIQNCMAYLEMIKHITSLWRSRGVDW